MQPQIILLREGTESSQGKCQLISNINACEAVVEAVRTTLGPRGMDKLIVDANGNSTISNDGATILKKLDIVHPAAKTLVDIAKSQDSEVGDGTTTVVLLAGEILKMLKPLIEDGVHPRLIIKVIRKCLKYSLEKITEIAVPMAEGVEDRRDILEKCAATALNSKLIHLQKDFFSKMAVDAVMSLDSDLLPLDMIGIKKVQGGALEHSFLVPGVAFKKTFSYAGFEMQPKGYENPKIALLNIELELMAERDNAEIRIEQIDEYQKIVDAEWTILYDKLDKIHNSGVQIALSKLPIGDVATQYFADRNMFCAGRVAEDDLKRTLKACGGMILTTVSDLNEKTVGRCELFQEKQIGGERYNLLTGCPNAKTATIVLRGGAQQFMDETERSLHDAIMIVRRAIKNNSIVAGGGAIEMELSKHLREIGIKNVSREQGIMIALGKALEIIPKQLCYNAGFDAISVLNCLRMKHHRGEKWFGVDILREGVEDNYKACVWEPAIVKINAISAAIEACCLILSVDETIRSPKSAASDMSANNPYATGGMGMQ